MLQLIPRRLHRAGFRLAHALRKCWWRLRRPRLLGCRVLAFDGEGRVLLIRHSYGSGRWMLPGGGIARGEAPIAAAVRELREETACRLEAPHQAALIEEPLHGACNVVHIVAGHTADMPCPDGREVVEARFFASDALPEDMPAPLRTELPAWVRAATAAHPAPPPPPPSPPPSPRA